MLEVKKQIFFNLKRWLQVLLLYWSQLKQNKKIKYFSQKIKKKHRTKTIRKMSANELFCLLKNPKYKIEIDRN